MTYGGRPHPNNPPPALPRNYLEGGYFAPDGHIKPELLTSVAQLVAQAFGRDLTNSQFRRFFDHLKAVEQRLDLMNDWRAVEGDVKKLVAFAAEAKAKRKVPSVFYDFIEKNVSHANNEKSFRRGFLEHIQAVLAFHAYNNPRRN
ncbi:MAG: type III-A CRISPR-associated protein Csm2 [Bacillota bacterium]